MPLNWETLRGADKDRQRPSWRTELNQIVDEWRKIIETASPDERAKLVEKARKELKLDGPDGEIVVDLLRQLNKEGPCPDYPCFGCANTS